MKQTTQIAVNELRQLFFSPVVWVLLIIFILQSGWPFLEAYRQGLKMMALDSPFWWATDNIYVEGLMTTVQHSLFLYIPLLTMGLISNEYSSGSIKLVYSSPLANWKFFLGKYLSVLCFGAVLLIVLLAFILLGVITIPHLSYPVIFSALLAFVLLFMAYAAIGLFISCLTEFQIVSAVITFAVFAILNYIGKLGQGIPLLRNICYWLCLPLHTEEMMHGLISSADVIYFVLIIITFITLSVLVISKKKSEISRTKAWGQTLSMIIVVFAVGMLTSYPTNRFYADVTETKGMTLSPVSQEILSPLRQESVVVTTYVNIADENYSKRFALPQQMLSDEARFDQYRRFLPHMKLRYIYYYKNLYQQEDNPEDALVKALETVKMSKRQLTPLEDIDCLEELGRQGFQMTRMVEACGRRVFLNVFNDLMVLPDEREITAAMAVAAGAGNNVWVTGSDVESYSQMLSMPHNRQALCNQGFIVSSQLPLTADSCQLAVVINPQQALPDEQQGALLQLLKDGVNAFIVADPMNASNVNTFLAPMGVKISSEELRQKDKNFDEELILGQIGPSASAMFPRMAGVPTNAVTMPHCGVISTISSDTAFAKLPLFVDKESDKPVAYLLSRKVNNREQRIVVVANAAWMSNREFAAVHNGITSINQPVAINLLYWTGGQGKYPLSITYPQPSDISINGVYERIYTLRWLYLGLFPLLLAILGTVVITMRKRF